RPGSAARVARARTRRHTTAPCLTLSGDVAERPPKMRGRASAPSTGTCAADTMKMGPVMEQTRRVAPRVPYDEAVAIARFDGRGRLYARALDLSATGIHVICAESCPLGTIVRCTLILPGGPRNVRGRVVRETVLARGVGLAIAFSNVDAGTEAAIDNLVESRVHHMMPAKLRVEGVDRALRCEGMVDERTVRLTATL